MPSRRRLLLVGLQALALAALPVEIRLDAGVPGLGTRGAEAKDGNGGGNGGGNGNGNGGGSSGNGGGNSVGGNGAGGSAKGNTQSGAASKGSTKKNSPDGPAATPLSQLSVERRHRNGVYERLANGRYEMRDARGRRIISRRATEADRKRFR